MAKKRIRPANQTDMAEILDIYAQARRFMAENGNPTQWGQHHPAQQILEEDILLSRLYVVEDGERLCGVFMFQVGDDPTYAHIEGSWRSTAPYGVIHRIGSDATMHGVLQAAVDFCAKRTDNLRIDTHADNAIMQHALEKAGFSRCGIIYCHDGSPRVAYQLRHTMR